MASGAGQSSRSVTSKISSILAMVRAEGGVTLTQIASVTRLPVSTVHRLVNELFDWQVLDRDDAGRYRLGPTLRCAATDTGALSPEGLRARATPVLEDLFRATGWPVRLGHLDLARVAYIQKVSDSQPVSRRLPAALLPAHATAMGKVLLAFAAPSVVDVVVAGLPAFTPFTITDPRRFRDELRTVRRKRMAVCDRELDPTWMALGVPVLGADGAVIAAIEMQVPDLRDNAAIARSVLVVGAGCLSRTLADLACVTLRPTG